MRTKAAEALGQMENPSMIPILISVHSKLIAPFNSVKKEYGGLIEPGILSTPEGWSVEDYDQYSGGNLVRYVNKEHDPDKDVREIIELAIKSIELKCSSKLEQQRKIKIAA